MKRAAAVAVLGPILSLALAACSAGPPQDIHGQRLSFIANPGAVIATELAFARAAQEKGQWTALAEFATDDAVMFAPGPVKARQWLKGQTNPPTAVKWQPHEVWSSCDGSLAVTRGAAQWPDGASGFFVTVWQRQVDGRYRWVLDHGEPLGQPLAEPEMVQALVADCPESGPMTAVAAAVPAGSSAFNGASDDGSMIWQVLVAPNCDRQIFVTGTFNGAPVQVVSVDSKQGGAGVNCAARP